MAEQTIKTRADIPEQYKWDLESIYPDATAWEADIEQLDQLLAEAAAYKGKLNQSAETLVTFLNRMDEITFLATKLFYYGRLPSSVDSNDPAALANRDRAMGIFGKVSGTLAFARPEMIEIGFDTLRQWLAENIELGAYQHFFDRLEKEADHLRSAEIEELLGMATDLFGTMNQTHSIMANSDIDFGVATGADGETIPIEQTNIRDILSHPDRELRRSGYDAYMGKHLQFKNSMANALAAGIKKNVLIARVRGYDGALDAALQSSYIPHAVFDSLLDTYEANLSTWHKYWAVRRRALGVDTLRPYDSHAPLSQNPPDVPYEQAVEWIAAGMNPLGKEYVDVLRRGATVDRWVDVYPNRGKRIGAFSACTRGTKPFIMLSYTDNLFGLSTLAHELGHSMHSYFTWENQPISAYARYGLFVAEVASNFNQAMVRAYLLDTLTDREHQIAIIEEAMANFYRYFFIMPTLARFERAIHARVEQGKALSADYLIEEMANLMADGYGSEIEADRDLSGMTWGTFHSHLYANFYVYKYATGISAAHILAEGILDGQPGAVDNYLTFLKAGGSQYPIDVLKMAGVDMTTPAAVEKTFEVLARYVDRLEALVAERP